MRLLVIDSSNTGDQRSPGILSPDAFQPERRDAVLETVNAAYFKGGRLSFELDPPL